MRAVMSQEQLAEKSGVARDTISKLETGQRRAYPTTVHKLAAGLGVAPQELVANEDPRREQAGHPSQGDDKPGEKARKKFGF